MAKPKINLDKDPSIDLSKPSGVSNISVDKKPDTTRSTATGIGIKQEIGTVGDFDIEARGKIDLKDLIPQQGITVERDTTNSTVEVGANVGSTRGKLGANIGIEIQTNPDGTNTIKEVTGGINVAGFGVSGRAGADGGIGADVSALGITIDVARDGKGGVSGGVSVRLPGIEIGIGFQPNEGIRLPSSASSLPSTPKGIGKPVDDMLGFIQDNKCYHAVFLWHVYIEFEATWSPDPNIFIRPSTLEDIHGQGVWQNDANRFNAITDIPLPYGRTPAYLEYHEPPNKPMSEEYLYPEEFGKYKANFKAWASINDSMQFHIPGGLRYSQNFLLPFHQTKTGANLKEYIEISRPPGQIWDISLYEIPCSITNNFAPVNVNNLLIVDNPPATETDEVQLPNPPQHRKKMNCCDKVEAIYRVLGCAKFEKKALEIDNAFLSPGAVGTTKYKDFYDLKEAEFRTYANGMIFNPAPAPNAVPFKLPNATAWATQMYEMQAESMSNGNSTQKVEISVIMQLAQMTKLLGELTDKIKFLSECIGYTPELDSINMPFCFTIHEAHKAFDPKKPKKEIDPTQLKTDAAVERTLTKMLMPSQLPIETWKFKADGISLIEILRQV